MDKELYFKLVCALTHDISACSECGRCGKGIDARLNLIKELAKEENRELPWFEKKEDKNFKPFFVHTDYVYGGSPEEMRKKYNFKGVDEYIAEINSIDRYKLPDDYDDTISRLNDWSSYSEVPFVDAGPCIVKLNPDGTPDLTDFIDAGPCTVQIDENGNPIVKTVPNKEIK